MSVSFGPKIPQLFVSAALGDNYYTVGEAMLRSFQALIQPNVISVGLNTPPVSPVNGDSYVVGTAPTGLWTGQANSIAYWTTDDPTNIPGYWMFFAPKSGWIVGSAGQIYIFGTSWGLVSSGVAINNQTANYIAALSDNNNLVNMTMAVSGTVTVPPNSSVAFPIGAVLTVVQAGIGQITFVQGAGVTINTPASLATRTQFSTISVIQTATDVWLASGDLA
jgi:hypothetical protein